MRPTIAKDFNWEMGHRLPYHEGGCRNVHGHSYRMRVIVEGDIDERGMVIDYFDLKKIIRPIVDRVDHAFLCYSGDREMMEFFAANPLKHVVVPFHSTVENISRWLLDQIAEALAPFTNLTSLTVRLHETERTYAEWNVRF